MQNPILPTPQATSPGLVATGPSSGPVTYAPGFGPAVAPTAYLPAIPVVNHAYGVGPPLVGGASGSPGRSGLPAAVPGVGTPGRPETVPEPSSWVLLAVGLVVAGVVGRWRKGAGR